jgi:hypothetical protein
VKILIKKYTIIPDEILSAMVTEFELDFSYIHMRKIRPPSARRPVTWVAFLQVRCRVKTKNPHISVRVLI